MRTPSSPSSALKARERSVVLTTRQASQLARRCQRRSTVLISDRWICLLEGKELTFLLFHKRQGREAKRMINSGIEPLTLALLAPRSNQLS